jgi:flagellar hook-associated protein 1 FlgK
MDEFFMAVSQLSGNPAGLVERSSMLSASKSLAQSIRRAAGALDEARSAAEADARLVVDQINTHTAEIALLNDQIHELEGVKQPVGELVDRRDALLKQLANNVDIRVVSKDNGMVSVFLEGSGDALIEGPIVGKLEVTGGGPVAIDMTIRKPSGTVISISNPTGGRLGGLLSARDTTLQTASDQLDLMAFTLIDEVNNAHQAGFDLAGNPGTAFFTPVGGVAGAARAIALSATVDGQPENIAASSDPAMVPGDDGAITAILALQDGSIVPGGKTLHEGYEAAVFTVSSALSDAKFRVKAETGRAADLAQARASVAGVSLHEEMASLSQAERAFQASARVVQTADQLYETLLQMV